MRDLLFLALGGPCLFFGANWLVSGAAGLARSFGLAPLVIGLTVVAYGTSAPEAVVSVRAAMSGHGEIALGNVVGSNIANLGLILGLSVLFRATMVDGGLARRELRVLGIVTLAVPISMLDGVVSRVEGWVLLIGAVAYTFAMVRSGPRDRSTAEASAAAAVLADAAGSAGAPPAVSISRARAGGLAVLGLAVLVVGGELLVRGATGIALGLGISERIVGLTIVAVGTSVPELATSLIAAWRGHADIAIGNVVGSNIFNVLLCLGGAAAVHPIGLPPSPPLLDVGFMIGMTFAATVMMRRARVMTRWEGGLLLATYATFVALLVSASR